MRPNMIVNTNTVRVGRSTAQAAPITVCLYRTDRSRQARTWNNSRGVRGMSRGRLCIHRKKINISTSLSGQAVGIREVEDGIWLISFMSYDLGYVDLEEKTLQPLENPFGPRV